LFDLTVVTCRLANCFLHVPINRCSVYCTAWGTGKIDWNLHQYIIKLLLETTWQKLKWCNICIGDFFIWGSYSSYQTQISADENILIVTYPLSDLTKEEFHGKDRLWVLAILAISHNPYLFLSRVFLHAFPWIYSYVIKRIGETTKMVTHIQLNPSKTRRCSWGTKLNV